MIRVGLIGAGFIGRNHFNQYEKMLGLVELVLCDKEADRRSGDWSKVGGNIADAQGSQRDLGDIRTCADWHDVIADDSIDMVDICLPTHLHREITVAALEAGKHVLCEKPMALTVEDCDAMLAAEAKSKGKLMVAQCIRFWPEYVYLKQMVDQRQLGALKAVHLRRQAARPDHSLNNWMVDPALSGGAVLDLHVHDVDYVLHLLGKPKSVHAQGYAQPNGALDRVHASWLYDDGPVVQLEGFWDLPKPFGFNMGFTAVFDNGAVVWDLSHDTPLTVYRAGDEPEQPEIAEEDAFYAQIDYFLDCIRRDADPEVTTPRESRDAVAIALAEKESVATGKPVTIA